MGNPPYSLSLILPLIDKVIPVHYSIHQHSTILKTGPAFLPTPYRRRSQCPLKITIIYTSVEHTRTVLEGDRYLLGEANLLRLIARMFSNSLYESSGDVNRIDEVLDRLAVTDGKHSCTKLLTMFLEKTKFLAGNELSLADLLGLSLMKSHNIEVPVVKERQKRCKLQGFNL